MTAGCSPCGKRQVQTPTVSWFALWTATCRRSSQPAIRCDVLARGPASSPTKRCARIRCQVVVASALDFIFQQKKSVMDNFVLAIPASQLQ